jgi:hypothetical protein
MSNGSLIEEFHYTPIKELIESNDTNLLSRLFGSRLFKFLLADHSFQSLWERWQFEGRMLPHIQISFKDIL